LGKNRLLVYFAWAKKGGRSKKKVTERKSTRETSRVKEFAGNRGKNGGIPDISIKEKREVLENFKKVSLKKQGAGRGGGTGSSELLVKFIKKWGITLTKPNGIRWKRGAITLWG